MNPEERWNRMNLARRSHWLLGMMGEELKAIALRMNPKNQPFSPETRDSFALERLALRCTDLALQIEQETRLSTLRVTQ